MPLFKEYERPQDKLKLKNVFVGTHPHLLDPASYVVVGFILPEGKSVTNARLAKRMLLELHTLAGLPRQGLIKKLEKLEGADLQRTFRDNFARFRELGVEYFNSGQSVEFYGRAVLPDADTMDADRLHLYAL